MGVAFTVYEVGKQMLRQNKHYRQNHTMAAPDNGSVEPAQVVPCRRAASCGM
jgi:hypothetical protein